MPGNALKHSRCKRALPQRFFLCHSVSPKCIRHNVGHNLRMISHSSELAVGGKAGDRGLRLRSSIVTAATLSTNLGNPGSQESATLETDVAIVGGGPVGLAVAASLSRVMDKSTKIKVFETSHALGVAGAGVALQVNGMRALEAIDPLLAHRLYGAGSFSLQSNVYDELTGNEKPRSPLPVSHDRFMGQTGHTSCLVYWNDIRAALLDSLPEGVVEFGCRLQQCSELPSEGVAAPEGPGGSAEADPAGSAEAGALSREPYRYHLTLKRLGGQAPDLHVRAKYLIGADGYFSRVRRQLGDGLTPVFTGTVSWRGTFTPEQLEHDSVPLPAALRAPVGRVSSHRWTPAVTSTFLDRLMLLYLADEGQGLGVWYLQAPLRDLEAAGVEYPPAEVGAGGLSGAEALRRALKVFAHLPSELRDMLAATPPERVTEHGLHLHPLERHKPGAWTSGHMVLVGDAAHATWPDGQGACLGLEDAVVLAHMVREHGGLGPQALAAWEAVRQPHVHEILADNQPPFATRLAVILRTQLQPLWRPEDLPVAAGSVEEGLAWSKGVIREIVDRKVGRARALAGIVAPPAPVPVPGAQGGVVVTASQK